MREGIPVTCATLVKEFWANGVDLMDSLSSRIVEFVTRDATNECNETKQRKPV